MTVVWSVLLFALAALAEIGGAWLVWQGMRENRGLLWIGPACSRWAATATASSRRCRPANFGRTLAAYGGVFAVGSLAWGMALDGFRPDRFDAD